MLALPAAGQAATTFGSRLNNDPANAGECTNPPDPGTSPCVVHPPSGCSAIRTPRTSAPVAGVITKVPDRRLRRGRCRRHGDLPPGHQPARPAERHRDRNAGGRGADGDDPGEQCPETPILEFPARSRRAGQSPRARRDERVGHLRHQRRQVQLRLQALRSSRGSGSPGPVDATGELLIQAVIEPDADGDGFGDGDAGRLPDPGLQPGPCDNAGPGSAEWR